MTALTRQVRRETRPIIVILEPGDVISFRQKGCRKVFKTTLGACYRLAVKAQPRKRRRR